MPEIPPLLTYETPKPVARPPVWRIVWSLFSGAFLIGLGTFFGFATIVTARDSLAAFGAAAYLAMGVSLAVALLLLLGGTMALRAAITGLRGRPPR
jgi:hypothetical protein